MRKIMFVGVMSAAMFAATPVKSDAGDRCRPVRDAVGKFVERWKSRTVRVGRLACEVAATVRPVVTLTVERSRPVLSISYQLAERGGGTCVNGRCKE